MVTQTSPFIARFYTKKNRYIYDVNTNDFFQVDNITFELLGAWERYSPDAGLAGSYNQKEPLRAMAQIEQCRNQGIFSDLRPEKLEFPLNRADFEKQISTQMQQLILNVTERCNLRCSYCVYSGEHPFQRSHSERNMSFEVAQKAVDLFVVRSHETDRPCVSFYGGEALLNIDLIRQVVSYIEQAYPNRVFHFQMTTNGALLRGKVLDYLVSKEISLLISLDGPKEVHDRNRVFKTGQGSFDMIAENLQNAKRKYPDYYNQKIAFACTLGSWHDIELAHAFFTSNDALFGNNGITVSWIKPPGHSSANAEDRSESSRRAKILGLFEQEILAGEVPDHFLRSLFDVPMLKIHRRCGHRLQSKPYPNGICTPGCRRLFCCTNGQLTLCERVNQNLVIGDVLNGLDLMKAYDITREYADISTHDCRDCWAIRFCDLCFSAVQEDRFNIERKRVRCSQMRRSILTIMSVYWSLMEQSEHSFDYMKDMMLR